MRVSSRWAPRRAALALPAAASAAAPARAQFPAASLLEPPPAGVETRAAERAAGPGATP